MSWGTASRALLFLVWAGTAHAEPVTIKEIAKLTPSDGQEKDFFGGSVAVSGDRVLVGAPNGGDKFDNRAGAAYLFDLEGNQLEKLTNGPAVRRHKRFGTSVALQGNRFAIGAGRGTGERQGGGRAYLYDLQNKTQRTVSVFDPAGRGGFGGAVGLSGDTLIVGASSVGSAYLFDLEGNVLEKLTAFDARKNLWFGSAVAVKDEWALVGASFEPSQSTYNGAAYLFNRELQSLQKLTASNSGRVHNEEVRLGQYFGDSVALNSSKALVGARGNDENGDFSGAAFLFNLNGTEVRKFTAPAGEASDNFGASVALSEDYAVIGAWGDDDQGDGNGAAYVYDLETGNLIQKLLPSDQVDKLSFGGSVAISGKIIVVGAGASRAESPANVGAAYVFRIND